MSSRIAKDVSELRERQEGEKAELRARHFSQQTKLMRRRRATNPADDGALQAINHDGTELDLDFARQFVELFERHVAELKVLQESDVFVDHEELGVLEDGLKYHQYRVSDLETRLSHDG